ncbi:MAG: hypothetical protein GY705_03290 [Bacteroidetes bacterium]|nr:hypothetical protein [Bacteroidota bacterium]
MKFEKPLETIFSSILAVFPQFPQFLQNLSAPIRKNGLQFGRPEFLTSLGAGQ